MTHRLLRRLFLSMLLMLSSTSVKADFAYYGLEPDIVTNYLGTSSRDLGYVRLTIELMIVDAKYLEIIEHHDPLIRATIIDIFGKQHGDRIKSLTGREEIRQMCLNAIKEQLKAETGSEIVRNLIFTKYLYQD
ncbi:flagellar basal body-associated protein FliL [Bowmanella sp. JS7-9]|uniref:Flagellar protein FliL n=1 Tax=Pseudobowmanella zhangzhouensis TaxID=1537679 RepID=A0ABW1XEE4_9ALTE|nr:flagellar basal body-associated protein FliL [Bowmanella sp. JS7-9]TBX20943.1 hypothetical protein TK45_14380 [Bowmanella sp. JS7-9]